MRLFKLFIRHGQSIGRSTTSHIRNVGKRARQWIQLKVDRSSIQPHFDATYYRSVNADLTGSDEDLLSHFMQDGWREGRDPHAGFSTKNYLWAYPDVAGIKSNPFVHFIRHGQSEGRSANPLPMGLSGQIETGQNLVNDLEKIRPHFDAEFYRLSNPQLRGSDEDLLLHFTQSGWREGRNPHERFSIDYYHSAYPEIAKAGFNPFLHYLLFGQNDGRKTRKTVPTRLGFSSRANITPPHFLSVLVKPLSDEKTLPPNGETSANSLSIHWVIPDLARGSGGHMTILRMVRYLETFGHSCKIWIERPTHHSDGDAAYQTIVKYFQCVQAEVAMVQDGFFEQTGDVVIATGWTTAHLVQQATGFKARYYFVQDHEPEFYPTGADYLMARQTYGFDLACICASPWLEQMMSERYGRWARHFDLAYDRGQYKILDDTAHRQRFKTLPETQQRKIAVYARDHTARRCVPLILMALQILGQQRQDFEVHFYGADTLPFKETNFSAVNHGILESNQLESLYNDCHIGVCFSGTNYSLVPQEMMACGLPLLELDTESTRAIFPEGVVTFGGPLPEQIAARLNQMLDNPAQCESQADAALKWVGQFSWQKSARLVEKHILEYLGQQTKLATPAITGQQEIELDVVIPTFNGHEEVRQVIEALRTQSNARELQIHCIDSSSSDGTTEWLRNQPDVALTVIDQKDFQHGRTRNKAAADGQAPLIAFLTQDAVPSSHRWSQDILNMMHHYPQAAGLFGRHLPYPDHPVWVRQEIDGHFEKMLQYPLALSKETDPQKWISKDQGWRQLLHFYSDNNSAMRRSVWNEMPYPEVDYGEDQIWARDIVEAGYTKLYAPTATVYHSHDYTPAETYARSKTEAGFFYSHFGYQLGTGDPDEIAERIKREQSVFLKEFETCGEPENKIKMQLKNIEQKHLGLSDGLRESMAAKT